MRNKIEIITDILRLTTTPANKTKIVYLCNLNFNMLSRYIKYLTDKGLIAKHDNLYTTTAKGLEAVESAINTLSLF